MFRKATPLIAAAALIGASSFALAQSADIKAKEGASMNTPGHQMQEKGSVKGTTGASGYTPGHQMQEKGSVKGTTGASGYAPGHNKTDVDVNTKAKVK